MLESRYLCRKKRTRYNQNSVELGGSSFEMDRLIFSVLTYAPCNLNAIVSEHFECNTIQRWEAKNEISKCDELFFIGYSLSDIDSSLQYMIYDAVCANVKLSRDRIHIINNQIIPPGDLLDEKINVFIATNDRELRKNASKRGIRTIYLRQKKFLETSP